jgi:hypothetical protein
MKVLYGHNVLNSFTLWFDNFLISNGEAYKTKNTAFYNYTGDTRLHGKVVYGSPFKQWVMDKSVTGATIPSGLTINGVFTPTGTSGLFFDFDNGRAIFNSGVGTGLSVSGTYTVKEFNLYVSNESEEDLIVENAKYETNSRFSITENYIAPYSQVLPAVFITSNDIVSEGLALGGENQTTSHVKTTVFTEQLYQLDGILSLFNDSINQVFSKVPYESHPMNEFGGIKTGTYPTGYSYSSLNNNYSSSRLWVQDVQTSKLNSNLSKKLAPSVFVGFIDFDIVKYRFALSQ